MGRPTGWCRVEDSQCWTSDGSRNAAEFLARRSGTTTGRARVDLETSRRLPDQPVLAGACRGGVLSPAQAAAVSDVVAADPDAEARLVDRAGSATFGELRDDCARVRAAADPDPDATRRRVRSRRSLRRSMGPGGSWNLSANGTVDAGARFIAALDPIIDEPFAAARRDGRRNRPAASAFDHRIPWARTQHTRLDHIDPLCTHHHRLKTHHHWALAPGIGPRPLVPPTDPRHPDQQLVPP